MFKASKIVITKTILLVFLSVFSISCQFKGIEGSGNVTTENRSINSSFKSIEVEKALEVVVEQSDITSLTVIADDNLQKHIITKVTNGILHISSDINNYHNVKSKKVIVKMPIIEGIQVSSAAYLQSRNTLKSNTISINSSSGAKVEVSVEADKAYCESSSGSQIIVKGKAISLETSSSSGSSIDAKELLSNDILADASSGSSINVYPIRSLKAEASSGANIIYFNTPKNLDKKTSSGGNIDKE
jgi:hypothetical protein